MLNKLILLVKRADGYKTYILAVIAAVYNLLVATGVISHDQATQINLLLGSGFVAALRSALKKLEK